MALLNRETVKEIESHFYGYQAERQYIEERAAEIAERADYSYKLAKAVNSDPADATHISAAQIERELGRLQKWVKVVEATIEKFRGTPYMQFMTMVYVERLSEIKVCVELYIGRRTYYSWKDHIIQYAAMKACEMGLISA